MMITYDDILADGTMNKVILFSDKTIGDYVAGKPQPIFFEVSEPGQEFVNVADIPVNQKDIV